MKYIAFILLFTYTLMSCKKQSETIAITDIKEYYPLQLGRVWLYRLDSTRVINFVVFSTASYLEKDTVVGRYNDAQGRTAYILNRFVTDTLQSQPFQFSESYTVVFDKDKIEFVDGANRRFIKLVNPVSIYTTWNGNSYLEDSIQNVITQNTTYNGWVYQYTSTEQPYSVLGNTYPNTCTILQKSDSSGAFNPNILSYKTYSSEVYAKGVGLINKDFIAYFWQTTPTPAYEDGSFGIKLKLISYNKGF